MTDKSSAYRTIIADLEQEISEYSVKIDEARATLRVLRRRLDAAGPTAEGTTRINVQPEFLTALDAAASLVFPHATKRTDVSATVLDAIRAAGSITSAELADRVAPSLGTDAGDKRKLVHSTVSYLLRKTLIKREDGLLSLASGNGNGSPPSSGEPSLVQESG